jgi:hypothetical protein
MIEGAPGLMAVIVLEELRRRYPMRIGETKLRALSRRVHQWRAEREIFFAQTHPPRRLRLSDFTVADALGVSVAGHALAHPGPPRPNGAR